MNSSRNIAVITVFLSYLGTIMSDDTATMQCINDIYDDFSFGKLRPRNPKLVMPITAYLKIFIHGINTDEGRSYFKYIHDMIYPTENMQLPRPFCIAQCNGNEEEQQTCIDTLFISFLDTETKLQMLRDVYWNYKETDFIKTDSNGEAIDENDLIEINRNGTIKQSSYSIKKDEDGKINYRQMYLLYLSTNFYIPRDTVNDKDILLAPRDYCSSNQRRYRREKSYRDSTSETGEMPEYSNYFEAGQSQYNIS